MTVKMTTKKKMMMLGLVLVTILMVSSLYVNAKVQEQKVEKVETKPASQLNGPIYAVTASLSNAAPTRARPFLSAVQIEDDLDIENLDDMDLTTYIEKYEALTEEEHIRRRCIWIVVARGYSWEVEPSTDAVDARNPMGIRFRARPVMDTGDGILFKVPGGVVGHDGERYKFEGYGWARKVDGLFYMKLDGEDLLLKVVGKVYPRNLDVASNTGRFRFHRVVMKGKMTVEGVDYLFALRGRAFRACIRPAEAIFEPSTSS
jgi:hypothetical protein